MQDKRNVLFIAIYFPPLGGGGVQRVLKFVKYMNKEKYNIHILTVNHKFVKYRKDYSLLNDLPPDIKIYRSFYPDLNWFYAVLSKLKLGFIVTFLKRYLILPDEKILFFLFSKGLLRKIILENNIDTIVVSLPPFGLYKFVPYLKRKYKIKTIVDFRDLWTDNYSMIYDKFPRYRFLREIKAEKLLIKNSDYIITATKYMKDILEKKYTNSTVESITNGYDPDDFKDFQRANNDILRFTYTGSLYGHRDPINLFKAIKNIESNYYKLSFDFYGFIENTILKNFNDNPLLHHHGYIPHSNLKHIYEQSDILLLYIGGYNKNNLGTLTGKLFEYLYTKIPILLIGPTEGEAAKIIRKCNAGFIVKDNESSILNAISKIYGMWKNNKLNLKFNSKEIAKYNRKLLTKRLEKIIDEL